MKPVVDRDLCIGCGLCEEECPEIFRMDDTGIAYVLTLNPGHEQLGDINECIELCPVAAISLEP